MVTAIQSNALPGAVPGATTATQPVVPAGNMTPADIQALVESMTPVQARFRQASTFLRIALDQASFTSVGQAKATKISNVGLGVETWTEWNIVINIANGATSNQTFKIGQLFPFNMVQNSQVGINGGATVYSVGGVGGYIVSTRQRRGCRRLIFAGAYGTPPTNTFGPQVDLSLVRITVGANLTATNNFTLGGINGIASISVTASANGNLTIVMITKEKLCLDRDSLLGALPLQNNATFIQILRTIANSLAITGALSATATDLTQPFNTAGANLTFTLSTCTADTTYLFASIPADPSLYLGMIQNSYQVQESTSLTVAGTGVESLKFIIPQNTFLVADEILVNDNNGAMLPAYNATTGLGNLNLLYNGGTVRPVVQHVQRERAIAFYDYAYDPVNVAGVRIWDAEAASDDVASSDNMMYLDTYSTADPELHVDVGASATVPLTYNNVREIIVAGTVQQVGG